MSHDKRLVVIFVILTVISSLISQQLSGILQVYATESSPYQSGYDHGCDDAGRSESNKYINQPEKGPSFHTHEFMNGYYAGLNACASGGSDGDGGFDQQPSQPRQSGGINWEQLCDQYGGLVGVKSPCNELADGTRLTQKGETALACLLGGGVTLLSGLDPATKSAIFAAGEQYCP